MEVMNDYLRTVDEILKALSKRATVPSSTYSMYWTWLWLW
jgi:hypothetical protein